jgi:hypothetical protein
MKFTGILQSGELDFPLPIKEERRKFLSRLKDGDLVDESLTIFREPKTKNQLGAHFGLMLSMAVQELDDRGYDTSFILKIDKPTGIGISIDLLKEYFYNVCPMFNDNGERIGLSKANTQQASKHFEDCRNFLASQWNINVPEPSKDWRNNATKS